MQSTLPANLVFDVNMFYGRTGVRQFKLLVGRKGEYSQKFSKLGGWFESVLGDYFEKIGFDPDRYEDCQTGYPLLSEVIGKHKSAKTIVVPIILEFKNGSGEGSAIRKLRHTARKAGKGFRSIK